MEWYEKYYGSSAEEIIAVSLNACSRNDCAHCLYQGMGIKCAVKLKLDAAKLIGGLTSEGEESDGEDKMCSNAD